MEYFKKIILNNYRNFKIYEGEFSNKCNIFYGENGEAEYSGDPKFFDKSFKPIIEWKDQYFKGNNFIDLIDYGIKNKKYLNKEEINDADLKFY